MDNETYNVRWQCNLKALIEEHLKNGSCNSTWALKRPWQIAYDKLLEVANVAIRINDPELNLLMCELALYTVGDGYHKDYNPKIVDQLRQETETRWPYQSKSKEE